MEQNLISTMIKLWFILDGRHSHASLCDSWFILDGRHSHASLCDSGIDKVMHGVYIGLDICYDFKGPA